MCTSNRDDRKLEITVKQSRFKHLGELHKGVNWSWSQCIKSHHAQTSSGKVLPSHFWNRNIVRSILPELRRKRAGLLLSGPKSSFQMKVHFAFHLEIRVPESGEREERHRIHVAADQLYGDADLIFQQDLAPAHRAKATSTWFKDHGIPVLNWPANSPDLNPIENLWGIVKRKMWYARPNNAEELKATIRATCASITPEQCHRLIVSMPRRIDAVIHAKGAPTKYWVHRN